jgi:hypothetical protein
MGKRVLSFRAGISVARVSCRSMLVKTMRMRRIRRVRVSKCCGVLSISRIASVRKSVYFISNLK